MRKINKIILILVLLTGLFTKPAFCARNDEFKRKIDKLRWIAYSPTNFDPDRNIYPSINSIRKDLQVLYRYGFNGIVTYGSYNTLAEIPRIALEVGFSGVIMGIWDIENKEETMNAILASKYVDGYCVGNEGLNRRYDIDSLNKVIANIKQTTQKSVTTTEEVSDYYNDTVLLIGDWVFPNIHPFLYEVKDPKKAAMWIEKHYQLLRRHCPPDKIILFKEVGFPTDGMAGATELNQRDFFKNFAKKDIPFVYFEAFDQQWKRLLACEPYWGLFNYKRKPKKCVSAIF